MRSHPAILVSAAILLILTLACGGVETDIAPVLDVEPEPVAEPTVDTAAEAAAEKEAEGSILLAGVDLGSFMCTEKSGDECVEPTTTFAADTPVIYFVHQTTDIPTKGQVYTIKWIATDVGDATPADTVVFELPVEVTEALLLRFATHYTISSEASKPDAGWPVGSYRVDVTLDGEPVTVFDYAVE